MLSSLTIGWAEAQRKILGRRGEGVVWEQGDPFSFHMGQ